MRIVAVIAIAIALLLPIALRAQTVTETTEWHYNQIVPAGSGISDGDRAEVLYCAKIVREFQDREVDGVWKLTDPTVVKTEAYYMDRKWRGGPLWFDLDERFTRVGSATIDFAKFPPEVGGIPMNLGKGLCQ